MVRPAPLPSPDIDHVLTALRGLRDELRLQVHLLKLDLAQDAARGVRTVADALDDVAQRLDGARERSALQTHLAWMDARDRFASIEPALEHALARIRSASHEVDDALPIEAARLRATLAAMDAKDAVERRRQQAAADLHDAKLRAAPFASRSDT